MHEPKTLEVVKYAYLIVQVHKDLESHDFAGMANRIIETFPHQIKTKIAREVQEDLAIQICFVICGGFSMLKKEPEELELSYDDLKTMKEQIASTNERTSLLPIMDERVGKILETVNRVWGNTYTNLCKTVGDIWQVVKTKRSEFSEKVKTDTIESTVLYFKKDACYGCEKDDDELNIETPEYAEKIEIQFEHLEGRTKNKFEHCGRACGPCNRQAEHNKELRAKINETAKHVKKYWEIHKPKPEPHPQGELDLREPHAQT